MKNKALHFMAAAVLSSALLMTGCGSHSGDTNSSTKQTQDQTQRGAGQDSAQTSAAEDQNQASDDQNQSQDTQTPETHPDLETRVETEVVQQPETQAPIIRQPIMVKAIAMASMMMAEPGSPFTKTARDSGLMKAV